MKNIILDSCVVAKTFAKEKDSNQATKLIDQCVAQHIKIIAPGIIEYELLQIAIKKNLPFTEVLALFENIILSIIDIQPMRYKTWFKAGEIANTGHTKSGFLSLYDSVYHAMAIENNGLFITADKKHYEKSKDFGHIALLGDWNKAIKVL